VNGGTIGVAERLLPRQPSLAGNYIVTGNTMDFNGAAHRRFPRLITTT